MQNEAWDSIVEVKFCRGNKITIPKNVVDRLKLKPGDFLKIGIKRLEKL